MFGDEFTDEPGRILRICCGPRCGAESEHRRIYAASETAVEAVTASCPDQILTLRPVMCQGYCGMGVTLVTPDGERAKIRAPSEARKLIMTLGEEETCPQ